MCRDGDAMTTRGIDRHDTTTTTTKRENNNMSQAAQVAQRKMDVMVKGASDALLTDIAETVEATMTGVVRGCDEWKAHYKVRLAVIEELERRYDVSDAMEAWAAGDSELSYVQALLVAVIDSDGTNNNGGK